MIKYFTNLSELKMAAKRYKADPLAKRMAIAGVGSQEKPEYILFLDANKNDPGFHVTVENSNKTVEEFVRLDDDDWIGKVKKLTEYYNAEFLEEPETETVYYCTNPDCPENGLITEPLLEESGKMVCPSCGEELSEEEDLVNQGMAYERAMEILNSIFLFCSGEEAFEEALNNVEVTDDEVELIEEFEYWEVK